MIPLPNQNQFRLRVRLYQGLVKRSRLRLVYHYVAVRIQDLKGGLVVAHIFQWRGVPLVLSWEGREPISAQVIGPTYWYGCLDPCC
jgi:hypothetical protein